MKNAPTPRPIRTTADNDFARNTVTHRLPTNIRNVIAAHPDYSDSIKHALEDLAASIAGDEVIPPLPLPAWDAERWDVERKPYNGDRWHDTEWFFAETYAFRLLLSAVRYFETEIDPYGPMKQKELDSGSSFLPIQRFLGTGGPGAALNAIPTQDLLEEALHLSMWGNRADISFVAGGDLDHSAGERELLIDDYGSEAAAILARSRGPVHIVMDNSGAELAGDLVLSLMIAQLTGVPVTLHLKFYPTYVSDTIVDDVHRYLRTAAAHQDPVVAEFARQVREAMDTGQITLAPDPYWCETRFLTEMPGRIVDAFAGAAMVIIKGDFNYRRGFRDTIWEPGTELKAAMGLGAEGTSAVTDMPWLYLRTMKSDCLAGVGEAVITDLDRTEPGWRTDGRRGVIQLVR